MLYTKLYPENYKTRPTIGSVNEFFEKIYYINLNRRKDRLKQIKEQLELHQITAERFPAIDGKKITIPPNNPLRSGELACLLSHVELIQKAIDNNYKSILIIEDDCEFKTDMQALFAKYLYQVPDNWDFLYFGGNHGVLSYPDGKGAFRINKNLLRIQHTLTTTCYGVSNKIYSQILDTVAPKEKQVDAYYAMMHARTSSYCFLPHLAWQRNGYSDIQEVFVDYSFLK